MTSQRMSCGILYSIGHDKIEITLQTIKVTAAAAKLLQSCLTLCNPIDGSP